MNKAKRPCKKGDIILISWKNQKGRATGEVTKVHWSKPRKCWLVDICGGYEKIGNSFYENMPRCNYIINESVKIKVLK